MNKKVKMYIVLLLVFLSLAMVSIGEAAMWKWYYSSDTTTYEFDCSDVRLGRDIYGEYVDVWTKYTYTDAARAELVNYFYGNKLFYNCNNSVGLSRYRMLNGHLSMYVMTITYYDFNGSVIFSTPSDDMISSYNIIPADTIGEGQFYAAIPYAR